MKNQKEYANKILENPDIEFHKGYISEKDANILFDHIMSIGNFSQSDVIVHGKTYKTPRMQCWMADKQVSADVYTKTEQIPWSEEMKKLVEDLELLLDFKFDYALFNLYRDGKDYISYHSDREAIGSGKDIIASISLGASRRFILRNNKDKNIKKEYLLEHGDLIIMKGDTQKYWQHTIPKMLRVKEPRLNITIRKS